MSAHNDALAMLRQAQATVASPVPGDAAGLIANALRLLQQEGNGADPAPDPQLARLARLVDLCRAAIDAEHDYDLACLARDTARRSLVTYVDLLEAAL